MLLTFQAVYLSWICPGVRICGALTVFGSTKWRGLSEKKENLFLHNRFYNNILTPLHIYCPCLFCWGIGLIMWQISRPWRLHCLNSSESHILARLLSFHFNDSWIQSCTFIFSGALNGNVLKRDVSPRCINLIWFVCLRFGCPSVLASARYHRKKAFMPKQWGQEIQG